MTAQPKLTRARVPEILPGLIGSSQELQAAAAPVPMIAESDVTCLLLGETGTGKELFARAIHYLSGRKHKPFVPVNCGAIPDLLFENELFGHARGAYTDASSPEEGLLAYAQGGTLFLDEVDALSLGAQVKLLRVLQEREYRPIGSPRPVSMNVRILAATNKDLRSFVEARRFREDLFYRLNVLWLCVPALRDHSEDIPLLAEYFVRLFGERHGRPDLCLDASAIDRLLVYSWPGNVREMQGILQRAVLLSRRSCLTADDLDLPGAPAGKVMSMSTAKDRAIDQFERKYLFEVLNRCKGNVSQAARAAGKERRTFQRLLTKHRIAGETFRTCVL
jgi:transcriptional regulator with GAF, ATPase, and Fis domain